jgi:iron complex outermembrane receptor protein
VEVANTWFTQKVDDWIQWTPQQNGNYVPKNIKQVLAEGFEMKANMKQVYRDFTFTLGISYQFTKSTTVRAPVNEQYVIDKQLIYTPQQAGSAFGQMHWKSFSIDFSTQYSGVRFTTSDNSTAYQLPEFAMLNASVGKFWQVNQHRIDFSFAVKNFSNTDYQMYAGRAMPGRNYNFQLSYLLKTKSNQE